MFALCFAYVDLTIVRTGKKLVESILEAKKWPKSLPKLTDRAVIHAVANSLIQATFFHRSEKVVEKKGYLTVSNHG